MDSFRGAAGPDPSEHAARSVAGSRLALEGLGAATLYALLTFCLLQPLLSDPAGSLFDGRSVAVGQHGELALKDVLLLAWIYAWGWHAVTGHPLGLYDSNAFHPYPTSLAFSEHALGKLPTAGLVFGLTDDAVLAHQIDLVASFALSAAAVYVLLRSMRVSIVAGLIAGAVFAFCPIRLETLHHSHLLGWQYLPLALLFLARTLRLGRATAAASFALLLLLQLLCSYYLAYMALVGVAAFAAAHVLFAGRTLSGRGVVLAVVAAVAVLVVFGALSWPYLELRATGILPRYALTDPGGALVLRHASSHPWRGYLDPSAVPPYGTASPFVGWVPLGVALVGCLGVAKADVARRTQIAAAIAIALAGWSLSLGPGLEIAGLSLPSPYDVLLRVVPGFSSMRAPGRFALLMMLGVAMLVGFGLDAMGRALARRSWPRPLLAAAAVALVVVTAIEYRLPWRRFAAHPVRIGRDAGTVNADLARRPPGVVAEFPFHGGAGVEAATAMLNSTTHWQQLVNGKSGYEPRGRSILRLVADRLPEDPLLLRTFVRLTGAGYVVVRGHEVGPDEVDAWLRLPGIEWVRRDPQGDLLGVVVLEQEADLAPLLLACAGYPAPDVGRDGACDALERELARSNRVGHDHRAPRSPDAAPGRMPGPRPARRSAPDG